MRYQCALRLRHLRFDTKAAAISHRLLTFHTARQSEENKSGRIQAGGTRLASLDYKYVMYNYQKSEVLDWVRPTLPPLIARVRFPLTCTPCHVFEANCLFGLVHSWHEPQERIILHNVFHAFCPGLPRQWHAWVLQCSWRVPLCSFITLGCQKR
ncbi:hypothetical protein BJV74DRAFT_834860 [Russula compacta]|nr:hypothetical protein BJV74DRAFT_834860 [Russula compacta]